MKIGFDLDKIFIEHPPFIPDSVIELLYKKKANGELLYRIPSFPEQLIRSASHHPLLRPPMKNNMDFLRSLTEKKHSLYLISSRFGFLKHQTEELISRFELAEIFDGMYFNFNNEQPHEFKNTIIKKLRLDIFVDDDLHLLKYVAKENKKTLFYWLHPKDPRKNISPNLISIPTLPEIIT